MGQILRSIELISICNTVCVSIFLFSVELPLTELAARGWLFFSHEDYRPTSCLIVYLHIMHLLLSVVSNSPIPCDIAPS